MVCIFCSKDTHVFNSRFSKRTSGVWRRRKCLNCNAVFSTRETPDFSLSIKVKSTNNDLEAFSEDKLFLSIYECFSHRKDAVITAKELTSSILNKLLPLNAEVIESKEIAEAAYPIIQRFDRVGAVYYQSHHLG